ncbi:MAG TPA: preprotein translocase subunit SecA [Vitreimonas sp.]|nr:preprotein translocase subunit SecA [Vitreimonas sp.]
MLKFITDLFDENKKALKRYQAIVDQINALEPSLKKLSDTKLAAQTKKFKTIIKDSQTAGRADQDILNEILPEAFATVREASRRVLGMRHFDVQLLAGIALHHGTVTEQKTGEGKTLTVTAPLYLNALLGKGVQLITVNDYLAEVGAGWMGQLYHFLGLSTSVIVHDKAKLYNPDVDSEERGDERLEHFQDISRQAAYSADITYGTNNEFGFDYLRDNMVQELNQMVQRTDTPHYFAIVDEADSILIDEARTPLIISAPDTEPTQKYYEYAQMVNVLVKNIDFKLDEKARSVTLTDLGVKRIEQKLGVSNLYEESFDTIHHVESALKAMTLYHRDKEYIIRDNQVIIVDEHTGRLMHGRRYSDGLHQAIEAKEGVPIQQESRTLATISLQNYFRLYTKLSGMTGTAVTEAEEFKKIYDMNVLPIPTNVPVVRHDGTDQVYKTTAAKYSAIVREVEVVHAEGRPILIGTRSIDHNQIISNFLKRKNIPHQVLNAKNNEQEAFIIADAGKRGSITVATNIAGRGVDIVLGGSKPELKDYRKQKKASDKASAKTATKNTLVEELRLPPSVNPDNYKLKEYAAALKKWQAAHDEVVSLGGLHIIGTERHESRRIDNQLRGRAGRQGDPGSSQFFVSLEDDIMRIFGGEQIAKVMDFLKIDENQAIEHSMVSKSIESAQVKVEGFFFDQRKRLVEFDDVMNKHREIIYKRRRRLLEESEMLKEQILEYLRDEMEAMVALRAPQNFTADEYDAIVKEFIKIIPFDDNSQAELRKTLSQLTQPDDIVSKLMEITTTVYKTREEVVGTSAMRQLERYVTLSTIDEKWMEHLDEMDNLRDGIWLRGDKNTVLAEYKKEGFSMFEQLIAQTESTIANRIFRVHIQNQPQVRVDLSQAKEIKDDVFEPLEKEVQDATLPAAAPRQIKGQAQDLAAALASAKSTSRPSVSSSDPYAKVGRNDLCPCGSGLKYKKCGLINSAEHQAKTENAA